MITGGNEEEAFVRALDKGDLELGGIGVRDV